MPIPAPFNVFTAFGDLWLDFGAVGAVLICLLLGLLAHRVHRLAWRGSAAFAWLTALIGSFILSSPISFRLLYMDSVFLAVLGGAVFATVQSGQGPKASRATRRPEPLGVEGATRSRSPRRTITRRT